MISMTGFGNSEVVVDGTKVSIQISSLNRKQTEIRVVLPRELGNLEKGFRDRIKNAVTRGAVSVKLELGTYRLAGGTPLLDLELARSVYDELAQLKNELHLNQAISVSDLLSIPDVNLAKKHELPVEKLSETAYTVLDHALKELITAKAEEGKSLQLDVRKRHKRLLGLITKIKQMAPQIPAQYQKKMVSRLQEYIDGIELDDDRIFKEVAIFADRCDISEEITRISSHLSSMKKLIDTTEPVGRKLDFLLQEIFREINTIGAKANDFEISTLVIDFKAELERIREQIQNIE